MMMRWLITIGYTGYETNVMMMLNDINRQPYHQNCNHRHQHHHDYWHRHSHHHHHHSHQRHLAICHKQCEVPLNSLIIDRTHLSEQIIAHLGVCTLKHICICFCICMCIFINVYKYSRWEILLFKSYLFLQRSIVRNFILTLVMN